MSDWNKNRVAASKPLPAPDNIIHEITYRDLRIVQTDDRRIVGSNHPDRYGFSIQTGFVILDEFDDHVMPTGAHWHYSPDDAALAIEMRDTILPTLKEHQPATTFLFEYTLMRQYRRQFWHTYNALAEIQRALDNAKTWDENPAEKIQDIIHCLRQNIAREADTRGERMAGQK
jgi:hypothetical protein